MSFDPRIRANDPERMDDPDVDVATMKETLAEVDLVNRVLGGWSGSLRLLKRRLLRRVGGPAATLLDLGAGSGGTARELSRWGRGRGIEMRWTLLDLHPAVCRVAADACPRVESAAFPVIRADARRLPFADRSFDFAHASLVLHHFDEKDIATILGEMRRVAREGLVVNDLERHPLAHAAIRGLTRLFAKSALVLHDAPLSVRRGFLPAEMRAWTRFEGLAGLGVRRRFPFRLLAWRFEDGVGP